MDSGTLGDGLVRVDALLGLLAIEEVGDELDDMGVQAEPLRAILRTLDLSILVLPRTFLAGSRVVLAEVLKMGAGLGGVEVDTLQQRVDFDRGLGGGGEGTIGTFASGVETVDNTRIGRDV